MEELQALTILPPIKPKDQDKLSLGEDLIRITKVQQVVPKEWITSKVEHLSIKN